MRNCFFIIEVLKLVALYVYTHFEYHRHVDRQALAYYSVPSTMFVMLLLSQLTGYASLYYKWLNTQPSSTSFDQVNH